MGEVGRRWARLNQQHQRHASELLIYRWMRRNLQSRSAQGVDRRRLAPPCRRPRAIGLLIACHAGRHLPGVWLDRGVNEIFKPGYTDSVGVVSGCNYEMRADSVADMAVLRHGAMGTVFDRPSAPSTLGIVSPRIHLRARPAARHRRLPLPTQARRSHPIPIKYTDALYDEDTGTWISSAEVARDTVHRVRLPAQDAPDSGRLVVRRILDLRPKKDPGQGELFDIWRFHAFFTTTDTTDLDTVAADKLHRQHAIVEQVHADLKNSALAHLPSGRFTANAAWLVCAVMAFNLTRAAVTLTDDPKLVKATTGTIRRTVVAVPARIASSARRLTLHLPHHWPWETAWNILFDCMFGRNRPIIA
ncbi:hypothetical protein GFS60_06923 (plasmid) [Rhodococcus sp. WAY2]|nr:hypothetical protein GFS60_06923 [Rhodococcus sp. WAY2]